MPLIRLLAVLLFLSCSAFASANPVIWPVDSLLKVFPDDATGTNRNTTDLTLLPRNGHASLQFAVRGDVAIPDLNVAATVAGPVEVQVRHVGYVPVHANTPKSPADELIRKAPARFPDPLYEELPFSIPANQTNAVWITLHASTSATPGECPGKAVFRSGTQVIASIPFRVRVMRATVPKQTLKVTNWFNVDEEHLRGFFNLGNDQERYWDLLANLAHVMSDHRQNVILTPVLSLTDARVENGGVVYDFSRLDRWLDTFGKEGLTDLVEGGHLLDRENGYRSALKVPVFVVDNGQVRRDKLNADDPRAETHMNSFLRAVYLHLKEKGLIERYVQHILDEAHGTEPPYYKRYAALVRKNMPGVKTMDAIDQPASPVAPDCDIWVPVLGAFDDRLAQIRDHQREGGAAWFYTCVFPQGRYMNRFIDYPLLKTRLLHWFNFRHDLSGYLHWGGNYWDGDPYQNTEVVINAGQDLLPPGDAFITYPWREKNAVRSSIRLEAMREGIEDYELLRVAEAKDAARARHIAAEAVPNITDYTRDVPTFRRLQEELLAAAE
ncbi:MAG: DUF4091 domain-containing protein [Bryobacteraceae bacterium]